MLKILVAVTHYLYPFEVPYLSQTSVSNKWTAIKHCDLKMLFSVRSEVHCYLLRLMACLHVNVNFNIVSMVTQMHTQRMDPKPIPCVSYWYNVKVEVDVGANGHAHVTCKQSLSRAALDWSRTPWLPPSFLHREYHFHCTCIVIKRLEILRIQLFFQNFVTNRERSWRKCVLF